MKHQVHRKSLKDDKPDSDAVCVRTYSAFQKWIPGRKVLLTLNCRDSRSSSSRNQLFDSERSKYPLNGAVVVKCVISPHGVFLSSGVLVSCLQYLTMCGTMFSSKFLSAELCRALLWRERSGEADRPAK